MTRFKSILSACTWAGLLSFTAGVQPGLAGTYNIANGDVAALIAAITQANVNPDADVINLAQGGTYTLTAVDNNTTGDTGLPVVTTAITINGNNATIQRSGVAPTFRIFAITGPNGDLTLNAVTIRGGEGYSGGGGLVNIDGTVRLIGSTVTDNTDHAYGGGIYNDGYNAILTLTSSSITNNSTRLRGDGIYNAQGNVTLMSSTVSGHTGTSAAIMSDFLGSALTLINSTVSDNAGNVGINNSRSSKATLVNSTVTGNTGGGIYNVDGLTATLKNTIVSNNGLGNCFGTITSLGHNVADDASCQLNGNGDQNSTNPQLGPLANNGGPTLTHAPLPLSGSPIIDRLPPADCTDTNNNPITTDQRGVARPQGTLCDIGSVELVPSGGPSWLQKFPANSPTLRDEYAMAYDSARAQVVLFGGYNGSSTFLGDTWVWDGSNWTQKSPANSPPARVGAAMAYDAAHGQMVLFGGTFGGTLSTNFTDTWVWDGTNWTQKFPNTIPQGRFWHTMAYDAAHGQVVMFGGDNGAGFFGDTWVWDGVNWTDKTSSARPPNRTSQAMAYDSAHSQIVLFGGISSISLYADTWVWDGSIWTQKSPVNSPPGRWRHGMAYDAAHGQAVLFGGVPGGALVPGNVVADTWVWDGTNWTQKSPPISPSARANIGMVYDEARNAVVLFGGNNGSIFLGDTWTWGNPIADSVPTSLALAQANPASISAGSSGPVTLAATLTRTTGGAAVAGATVTFSVDGSSVGTPTTDVNGGATVSYNPSALAPGTHTIQASFAGQAIASITYGASTSGTQALNITVPTTLVVAAPVPPSVTFGSAGPVALSAKLTRATGGTAVVGATVGFTVDGSPAGTGLTDGSGIATFATYNPSALMAGPHPVAASFGGLAISGITFESSSGAGVILNVLQKAQTITFTQPADHTFGDPPFSLVATSDSGLIVAFSSTTPGVCTILGSQVTIVAAGSCSINANQAGDPNYLPATQVTKSFTVNKKAQTITFTQPADHTFGDPTFSLVATSDSGLIVAFSSTTPGVCTVLGSLVTIVAAGSCSINANQQGDPNYLAAPQVTKSFTVNKKAQTITFTQPADHTFGDPPFNLVATSDSGLIVAFSSTTPGVCTVLGSQVTIVAAGSCSINANQPGDPNYLPAAQVTKSFTVNKKAQTITFGPLANMPLSAPPFTVNATATSGLAVTFSSLTMGVCTVSGNTVTLLAPGTCSIQANQGGNGNYMAAPAVTQSFTVIGVDLTIQKTHAANFSQGQTDGTYAITVTNSGGGPSIGTVQVVDTLPIGLTATAISGIGWTCTLATLTCTRNNVLAGGGAIYPVITLTVSVSASAPASVTNQATVAGGGEINMSNDTVMDITTINPIVNVSGQASVTQTGFGRNRSTGLWVATMTVTNTGVKAITAPMQVVFKNLTPGVTMANNTGIRNGSPYLTVLPSGTLAPGASVSVPIQFANPSSGFINFIPEVDLGVF